MAYNGTSRVFQWDCHASELSWLLEAISQKEICCCHLTLWRFCSDLSEYMRSEPDSWLLLPQWEPWGVSAGRSTRGPWGSFWLLLFSPCPSGWPVSECIDWRLEWLKFLTPGKARWLCCLWSNLVPVSVGVLALAIVLFLESGKMPCLFWLLFLWQCLQEISPLQLLETPSCSLNPAVSPFGHFHSSIVNKLTTVLNTYRFLRYPV